MSQNVFGKKLTEARISKGWSVSQAVNVFKDVANRSLTDSYLFQCERGYKIPPSEIMVVFCFILDLDPDEMYKLAMRRRVTEYTDKYEGKHRLSMLTYNQLKKKAELMFLKKKDQCWRE